MADGRLRSGRVILGAAFLGMAASGAACGVSSPEPVSQPYNPPPPPVYEAPPPVPVQVEQPPIDYDQVFYCATEDAVIVAEEYCDGEDFGAPYYLYHSRAYPRGLRVGVKLPSGGEFFAHADSAARAAWGLPTWGPIRNGGTLRTGIIGGGSGTTGG